MLHTGWDNDRIPGFEVMGFTIENRLALTGFNSDKLVDVVMNFRSDVLANIQTHHHQL